MQHKVNLTTSLTSLNSEFSLIKSGCHAKVKELSHPYYLPIAERIVGCISFPRILALSEMQSALSRI